MRWVRSRVEEEEHLVVCSELSVEIHVWTGVQGSLSGIIVRQLRRGTGALTVRLSAVIFIVCFGLLPSTKFAMLV